MAKAHRNSETHKTEMLTRKRRRDLRESSVVYLTSLPENPQELPLKGKTVVIIGKSYPRNSERERSRRTYQNWRFSGLQEVLA